MVHPDRGGDLDSKTTSCVAERAASFDILDGNGDGVVDVIVADSVFGALELFAGDGSGGFAAGVAIPTSGEPLHLAGGDVDGDAIVDLAYVTSGSSALCVRRGLGAGAFGPEACFSAGWSPNQVAFADLDGDGMLDALVANTNSNDVSVLLGRLLD